jgi:glycosyltransferase involved in cell wall biosynthesis
MRIAVLDYKVLSTNPIGGCHLRMLRGLCAEHEFTVFAVKFDNPCPDRIRFVRVPAPSRPLALLFLAFHVLAPLYYWAHRLRHRIRFDLVQLVESDCSIGDISYTQFCHRAFLKTYWRDLGATGIRGRFRWLDHWLHALCEPFVFRRVQRIVVPSGGLARELSAEFPCTQGKVTVIPNPVDFKGLERPPEFERADFRRRLGLEPNAVVLVFAALGHFERKGLPLLLQAIQDISEPALKLVVVGGEPALVASYQARVARMGLTGRVVFAGMQRDLRPYLWSADAFAFPSFYEAFPLVSLEAAAAGLPLIATPLNGVEEILRDGENGYLVSRSPGGIADGIRRLLALSPEARARMGEEARSAVARYDTPNFISRWRDFYGNCRVA